MLCNVKAQDVARGAVVDDRATFRVL